jgi:hypothetical protein
MNRKRTYNFSQTQNTIILKVANDNKDKCFVVNSSIKYLKNPVINLFYMNSNLEFILKTLNLSPSDFQKEFQDN